MPFSIEDKHAIKILWQTTQYGAKFLILMFLNKQGSFGGLQKLICKIYDTRKVDRRSAPGSGCSHTAYLADKINKVDNLVLRQDNGPKSKDPQHSVRDCTSDGHFTDISQQNHQYLFASEMPKETPNTRVHGSQQECTTWPLSPTASVIQPPWWTLFGLPMKRFASL
jgi:hypothetical protein